MKRTTVFADEADLAVIKAAAARRGVAEAELIREAIHLAAMADRRWDEPFFADPAAHDPAAHDPAAHDPAAHDPAAQAEEVWTEQAADYERTRTTSR